MSYPRSSSAIASPTVSASESTTPPGSCTAPRRRQAIEGVRSCAECRRLKLRCDRQFPCTTCTRRGCAAICPDGHLTTGQGNRFVLASTEDLHQHIQKLSYRVRALEDGLRESHAREGEDAEHPLLTADLAAIKAPLQRSPRTTSAQLHGAIFMNQPPTPSASSSGQFDFGDSIPSAYDNFSDNGAGGSAHPPRIQRTEGMMGGNQITGSSTEMPSRLHLRSHSAGAVPNISLFKSSRHARSANLANAQTIQPPPGMNYFSSGAAYYAELQEQALGHAGPSTSQYMQWSHAPSDSWDGYREGYYR